jgi:hypothetical protein
MVLVIKALRTIIGKLVKDDAANGDVSANAAINSVSDPYKKTYLLFTTLIASAAQQVAELEEIDIHTDLLTTKRVGQLMTKMRLPKARQGHFGKRGWYVCLNDVVRWANSYGLDPAKVTGIQSTSLNINGSNGLSVTIGSKEPLNPWGGIL